MAEQRVTYEAEGDVLSDLPRHLRNSVAMGGNATWEFGDKLALRLARTIERGLDAPRIVVVDRTPPFAALAILFWGLMLSAQICAMLSPGAIWIAGVLAGWLHG